MSEHVGGDTPARQAPPRRRSGKRKAGSTRVRRTNAQIAAANAAAPGAPAPAQPGQQPLTRAASRAANGKAPARRPAAPGKATSPYAPLMSGLQQTFPTIGATQAACVTWFNAAATVMKLVNGWQGSIAITATA